MEGFSHRQWIILAAEITATGLLGLLLFLLDVKELAQITWIIGSFQILARYTLARSVRDDLKAFSQRIDTELDTIRGLANVVDTTAHAKADSLRQLCDLYFRTIEPEFMRVKDRVVEDARMELDRLAHQKRSGTLFTGEYYNWLLPILRTATPDSEIWAISMMMDCEWDDSPEEREFLNLNVDAVARGVRLSRIFVFPQADYDKVRVLPPVVQQCGAGPLSNIRYVFRERLQRLDPQLLTRVGDGLIAIGSRVALIDEHSHDGTARGYVTMNNAEISRCRSDFDNLLAYSDKLEPLP
ncbi:hypothetical protein [Glycomyces tritici]|uniref:Uncharacterized protein n=1 Tax=Glycomyces tritici TaxID=2665176 RepID=A0ABT7YQG1_9ACTN|nr:hypothetical protein [Glycomyces tritici]MDN3240883.1 hypothetical protein [Glycomyces tritici]MDN3242914.1 hypothetical protein [Glycomyces tritici]